MTTGELVQACARQQSTIVDIRSADAYNGWPRPGENRGGHIPGARSLPFKWSRYMDWIEVVRQKGITPDQEIIVCGDDAQQAAHICELFTKSGYRNIRIYDRFASEWLPEEELPLDRLERFQHLVPAGWVSELTGGGHPLHWDNDNYVLLHAHYRNREAYLSGHIPGAIDMDTLAVESPDTWNRRTPEELKRAFMAHGITADTTVVLYGKYMHPDKDDPFPGSAAGDIGAIRIALIMMYAGVKDVRVLNGGFQSWKDAGFEISEADEPKSPVADFGSEIPQRPDYMVDTPEAREMLRSKDAELVCVRSWPEYIGEVSGYNYIEPKGRIPGAAFADCGSDAYHMENYRNVDHTTREYQEIAALWKRAGITPDKHLAFYCGTGWRGSEAWFNAWLMGWPSVSVFDGGWFEWSADPGNPVGRGLPGPVHEPIPPASP